MEQSTELVRSPDNQLWHVAHVPLNWKSGVPAKCGWSKDRSVFLKEVLTSRLGAGGTTKSSGASLAQIFQGYDQRAQLKGIVTLSKSLELAYRGDLPLVHLNLDQAWVDSFFGMDVKFGPIASFRGAVFSDEVFLVGADFSEDAWFDRAIFLDRTFLMGVSFRRAAQFKDAEFLNVAEFENVNFLGPAEFRRARFHGSMHFSGAVADGAVLFREITWPLVGRDWHGSFSGAHFKRGVSFVGAGCRAFAAFGGATLEGKVEIDLIGGSAIQAVILREYDFSVGAAKLDVNDKKGTYSSRRDYRCQQLEQGCLALKHAMAARSDRTREHMFYRFELMARNAQSTTPWQERWASNIYEAVSDYGTSITRPLACLLPVWLALGLVYIALAHAIHGGAPVIPGNLSNGFDLSLNRMFQPLTILNADTLKENRVLEILFRHPWSAFVMHVLGMFQSLISIILLFLSGLALRRRFQIN